MELVTIADSSGGRPGMIVGERIFDLKVGHPSHELSRWRPDSVVGILDAGEEGRERLQALHDALSMDPDVDGLAPAWLPLHGTDLGPPIRRPGLLLSLARAPTGGLAPLLRSPNTLAGPDQTTLVPKHWQSGFGVRSMVAVVIGQRCYQAGPLEAQAAIGGTTLVLEFSSDVGLAGSEGPFVPGLQGRYLGGQQPGSFVIGPRLKLTPGGLDEDIVVTVDDVTLRQWRSPTLADIGDTLAELSAWFGFRPGDLVAFGPQQDRAVALEGTESLAVSAVSLGELRTRVMR